MDRQLLDPSLAGHELSRTSSASSSGASPSRPAKSERRRSSVSPEAATVATMTAPSQLPTPPQAAMRSGTSVGLNVTTSSPLSSIRVASTPASPRQPQTTASNSSSDILNLYHSPSRPELGQTRVSQDSFGASSLSGGYSLAGSVSPQPTKSSPVASFTAGMRHTINHGAGPLKIESTTGSKTTIIKDTRPRSKSKGSSRASSNYGGGISSEDVFGKRASSAASESDTPSHASSKKSSTSRRSSGAFGSMGRKKEKVERGISSADVFPPQRQASTPSSPSLANMLQGLRRGESSATPQSPNIGAPSSSRSSSRASGNRHRGLSSGPSDISESDSVASGNSSNARRRHRGFPNVFRRKTSAEQREEEEHLQALADLRLRALALANADDESTSTGATSTEKDNAEALVRNMQEARLSAIPLNRQPSSATDSSNYSQQSPIASFANHSFAGPQDAGRSAQDEVLHIRSPKHSKSSSSATSSRPGSALAFNGPDFPESQIPVTTGSDAGDATFQQHHAIDVSEDEAERQAILAESRRRSTLVPGGRGSPAQGRRSPERQMRSGSIPGSRVKRAPSEGQWLNRNSFDGKKLEKPLDSGDEADMDEAPLEPELLERRRSTLKAGRVSPTRSKIPVEVPLRVSSRQPSLSASAGSRIGLAGGDDNADLTAITDAYAPPTRSSSRPISPEDSRPVSPLKFRSSSFFGRSESPSMPSPTSSTLDRTVIITGRDREASVSSRFAREMDEPSLAGAGSSPPSPTQPRRIFDELSTAITAAMDDASRSPTNISPRNDLKSLPSPPLGNIEENPIASPGRDSTGTLSPTREVSSSLPSQNRSPSDVALASPTRPTFGHHRTSSSGQIGKAISPPPGHKRTGSSTSQRSIGKARPAGMPRLPSHSEAVPQLDMEKVRKLLVRNRPAPRAALLREDLRRAKTTGERAVLYAQKINDLSVCESGLEYWIMHVRPPAPSSAYRHTFASHSRKGSDATFRGTLGSSGPYQASHLTRDDNMSEAPFPLRKGSQDVYRARDITQRTPSVAPSTMVPSTIPYPGVYDNSQTLRTASAMSNYSSTSSNRQQANFAAAALNAAGLPSRSFFGLGRKASKRAPSISQQRQQRSAMDSGTAMSISSPLQPPPGPLLSTLGRNNGLRPSGPRPSISSSSSDIPSLQSTTSIHSLASSPQPRYATTSPTVQASQLPPTAYSGAVNSEAELLTAMSDILPMAGKDVLLRYLRAAKGDHLAAIGRYVDDERAGLV